MKYRITQTLVSAFEWAFKKENGYEEFLRTLNREKTPITREMLLGTQYENILNNVLNGEFIPPDHEWYKPVLEMASELDGAQQQVSIFREICVENTTFLVHGVLDYLKAGHIYDCKFSQRYSGRNNITKYMRSPQTSFYAYLVPEAKDMIYIISDGHFVYRETYARDIIEPAETAIKNFKHFLENQNLVKIYQEKWRVQ